ncbi:uncharacterized protein LOC135074798 [Ostrinia nubilalis]|uniref:uncharacterized protein LOC135074798 n=1 Tax=Ostrinia nubilalis TaxID=29057 RepID=UPI0030823110
MAGEGERASRPSSLLLEAAAPEREPLRFDVQLVGAPPEVEQLVNNIKQVAEDFLYHWKTFPIVLPPSRFSGAGNRPCDIIVAPPCDELDAAALDAGLEPHPLSPKQLHAIREKGLHKDRIFKPKKLSAKQLESIREWGEFEVPSRHFPGQTHVWRVAGWLQRGRARSREDLYCHVARAVALIVVVARDRLLRDEPLSVIAGAKSMLMGLHRLLDLAFGMPSLEARDLDKKIREERSRYLVAELICMPEHQEDIAALAAWVTRAMRRAASEKTDAREASRTAPRVPCLYTTPQRTQVDLRLYRRELTRKAAAPLQALLEREARGWFLHFRERRAAQLASQKVPLKDIEQEVRTAAMREYVSRVCRGVLSCERLLALGPDIPQLLAQQLRAAAVVDRAEEGVRRKLEAGLATAEARICAAHPILSRAETWRKERLALAAQRLRGELRWAAMEDAAAAMQALKLHQHRYFLLRDLTFLRDREPLLMKELRAAKTPTREFTWSTRIWLPQNWVVVRHFRGRSERIPTVLSTRATSIVTPRSDPSQPVFLVDKERIRTTSTRWPGWRLVNLAHRTWCWSWNLMFLLGVLVPWCSPISLRTLLCVRPFVPDYELSQVNGTLFPKRSSETQTMWSRLLKLWRHISKERTRFETEPDTGLLGKGLSRQANRVWNYGVVGGLGSLGLLLGFPLAALGGSALSLAAAATVPLWAPPLTLAVLCGCALLYDLDCPDPPRLNRFLVLFEVIIWRIVILGVLQPIVAFIVAVIICPLCALLLLVGGVSWWGVRGLWEQLAWAAVIRRAARVPAHESAFCRRVRGPGLHTRTYYQITCAQAVAAVVARGELESLSAWASELELAIERPLRDYAHFVDACFGPFSVQIAKTGAYKQLEKECMELTMSLREKVSSRRRDLALGLSDAARARVRMTTQDLRRAVQTAAAELSRVFSSVARSEEWWTARGLELSDWHALAANTLVEVFDAEVLVALEESEARLPLEAGEGVRAWVAHCGRDTAPPDVLAERDDWRPEAAGTCHELSKAPQESEARLPLEAGEGVRAWAAHCGRDTAPPDVLAERDDWRPEAAAERDDWRPEAAGTCPGLSRAPQESEARLPLEAGEGVRAWAAHCGRDTAPPDVLAERDDWRPEAAAERDDWRPEAAGTCPGLSRVPQESEARLPLEAGEGVRAWAAHCGRDTAPPDVLAERDDWRPEAAGVWCEWGGTPAPRVPAPALELSAFSPRAPPHPPVPHPAAVALVLHNRESDNPVPLDSELCAEILRTLEDAPDCDDRRECVERYRGGGSDEAASSGSSAASPDDERPPPPPEGVCRVSPSTERAACRWTLTGRGVRLRADLASPEDVTLDADRAHVGTSV